MTETKNKVGRPPAVLDVELFENLCGLQCTKLEICDVLKMTDKTLDRLVKKHYKRNFSVIFKLKKGIGKISLRRAGWQMAQNTPSVHIFYAKNHLGMSDKPNEDEIAEPQPVSITIQVEDARKEPECK